MKGFLVMLSLVLSANCYAQERPTRLIGQQYNNVPDCIKWRSTDCLNVICMNSPDRNCEEKCKADIEKVCKQEFGKF
ncbi:hypothetical protein [Legionella sp. W05-934-2]|jgi:hypothetical protein|uniref:hypothetical protein n=1 Tax=Legionella sp. W05-934-2 TaxID=1198649 RepID=UPI003461A909